MELTNPRIRTVSGVRPLMKNYKCNMDAQTWQLYSKTMNCDEVAEILNTSFNLMAKDMYGATKKPGVPFGQQDAIDFAEKLKHDMRVIMSLFSHYGAYDSEPDGMLAYQVQQCHDHYYPDVKIEVGRWSVEAL